MNEIKITRQEIISLCRLCLAKDLASIDIFEDGNELRHLYTKIVACLPVQIFSSDTLPHKICEVCNAKVDDFYQFWTSTARNQKQLNDWLQVATDQKVDHDGTSAPRIKVEVEEQNDYDDDYDDGAHAEDSDDEEDEASAPKRIKTAHSDEEEEDTKPTHLVADSDVNGKRKSKEHKRLRVRNIKALTWNNDLDTNPEETKGTITSELGIHYGADIKEESIKEDQIFILSEEEERGQLSDEGETKFQCRLCLELFDTKKKRKRHERVGHPSKGRFSCNECDYTTAVKYYLVKHRMRHIKEYTIFCDKCQAGFLTKHELNVHKVREHDAQRLTCPVCKKLFTSRNNLTTHSKLHLPSNRVHQCDTCGKSFTGRNHMKRHIRSVHLKKGAECTICHKILNSTEALYAHNRIHNDERPFVCPTCGKASRTSSALVVHLRTHTGEKPYKCEFCGKGFTQTSSLAVHRRIHTGQRPHACTLCTDKFTTKHLLKHHMSTRHRDVQVPLDKRACV